MRWDEVNYIVPLKIIDTVFVLLLINLVIKERTILLDIVHNIQPHTKRVSHDALAQLLQYVRLKYSKLLLIAWYLIDLVCTGC